VESIDQLKTLYEIGVLTASHQLDIASLLSDVLKPTQNGTEK